jgi:hypothetical protein
MPRSALDPSPLLLLPSPAPRAGEAGVPKTRRRGAGRWAQVLAAGLLAVSLGQPWRITTQAQDTFHAPIVPPVQCAQVLDWAGQYQFQCAQTQVVPGWMESRPQTTVLRGTEHPGRFGLIAGLVLVGMAWRGRRRRRFQWMACGVVAVSTALCAGFGSGLAGPSLAWLAVAVLGWGSMAGRLVRGRRRWPTIPSPTAC